MIQIPIKAREDYLETLLKLYLNRANGFLPFNSYTAFLRDIQRQQLLIEEMSWNSL